MKTITRSMLALFSMLTLACHNDDDTTQTLPVNTEVNFQYKSTIVVGGEGSAEISSYDEVSKKLFITNSESNEISVYNIENLEQPIEESAIGLSAYGSPNSVTTHNGKLAVAVEALVKQDPGKILTYDTSNLTLQKEYTVGALPDMVTFSKEGNILVSANEGEPNGDYTIDPVGSISIIDLTTDAVSTLGFEAFNSQETALEAQGFRVFGPGADLAKDVEPEYIAISEDSRTAWVSLQENNGIAKVDLIAKTIDAIYPLGYKDFNQAGNEIDASDKDLETTLKSWNVKGIYQPDAIVAVKIGGVEYVISANEGDSRDYDGFSEEERVEDLMLDTSVYPVSGDFQNEINLGRLKTTTTLGDVDNDNDVEQIYSYGARSFSIWSANGSLVYDSGNSIATETLATTPSRFNDADKRSDDKGAEPESVAVLNIGDQRHVLFVGLERTDQVMVYDITNPLAPTFLTILSHGGDEAPEGLLVIPADQSPTGNDLLVVSNEDSGTVSFYENKQ